MPGLAQCLECSSNDSGALGRRSAAGKRENAVFVVEFPVRYAAEDLGDGGQDVAEGVGMVCYAEFVVGGYAGDVEVGVDLVVREARWVSVDIVEKLGTRIKYPSTALIRSRFVRDIVDVVV